MKNGKIINIGKFTKENVMKANRMVGRELDLVNSTGWLITQKRGEGI